jgi:hypothetical protein
VSLDPGWAAVVGAVAGGTLGVTGTIAGRWGKARRRERREDFDREGHLRDLEARRKLYARFLHLADQFVSEIRHYQLLYVKGRPDVADPEADARVFALVDQIRGVRGQLDLIAKDTVQTPFTAVDGAVQTLELARQGIEVFVDEVVSSQEARDMFDTLVDAMRADLRILAAEHRQQTD